MRGGAYDLAIIGAGSAGFSAATTAAERGARNRYGQRPERLPGKPDREIASFAELAALVGAQS